jgi:hypothetical protein
MFVQDPQNPAFSPIWQEFLNAAETVKSDNHLVSWLPAGHPSALNASHFTLLESSTDVNHRVDANHNWLSDGMFAQALEDRNGNIIIAYDSTSPERATSYGVGSTNADLQILAGHTPQAFFDADAFAKDVIKNNPGHQIFLEGHSLGGAEAEFVGNREHLSGVTFGAPGTRDPFHQYGGLAPNQFFVNFVDNSDLVGNFGRDQTHFGQVSHLNSVVNSTNLLDGTHHLLPTYAADLHIQTHIFS